MDILKTTLGEKRNSSNIDILIEKTKQITIDLYQDTEDTAQLNPNFRIASISNVWNAISGKIGAPKSAIDIGSGFGYGVLVLHSHGIQVVGIEKVIIKNAQAFELFNLLEVEIHKAETINTNKAPSICEINFHELENISELEVDLLTMFYVSGELLFSKNFLKLCYKLLKEGGKLIITTHISLFETQQALQSLKINKQWFSYEIIEIEGNFESIAVIFIKQSLT